MFTGHQPSRRAIGTDQMIRGCRTPRPDQTICLVRFVELRFIPDRPRDARQFMPSLVL
jgi:hypothetical protein